MSQKSIKEILLVEDNLGDALLFREMLNELGSFSTHLTHVEYLVAAEKHLAEHSVDIVLIDLYLPDAQGLGAQSSRERSYLPDRRPWTWVLPTRGGTSRLCRQPHPAGK
jgi:CheY-like chemotaxis protein